MSNLYEHRCKVCDAIAPEGQELCTFCQALKDQPSKKEVKKKVVKKKESLPNTIKLTCTVCKKEYEVRASHKELYTEEVKAKWVCIRCSFKKEDHK